jgi:hypothetical protein
LTHESIDVPIDGQIIGTRRSLVEGATNCACLLVAGRWSLVDENENEIDNKPTDETNHPSLRQF